MSSEKEADAMAKLVKAFYSQGMPEVDVCHPLPSDACDRFNAYAQEKKVYGFKCPADQKSSDILKKVNKDLESVMDAMKRKQQTPASFEELEPLFKMNNTKSVQTFISRHNYLFNLTLEALSGLQSEFGKDVTCFLTVIEDSEDESGSVLALDVEAPPKEHQAYSDRIGRFKAAWWPARYERANLKLVIDLRYS